MALTYTPIAAIGTKMPAFSLKGTDGKTHHSTDLAQSRASLVMFICNHCPYVKAIEGRLRTLAVEFMPKGLKLVAINSNDVTNYPDDSFEKMKLKAYPFPYLFDETQSVAKKFGAVCTPDFFLYDDKSQLVYRGRLDDSWKDESQVTSRELASAIESVLNRQAVASNQKPSMGCNIKWQQPVSR